MTLHYQNKYTTIGVNNLGQLYFHPNYLVVVDMIDSADNEHDLIKVQAIKDNESDYTFSYLPIETTKSPVIRFMLNRDWNSFDFKEMFNRGILPFKHTSITCAMLLAQWMGFTQVGIVGFDLTNHVISDYINNVNEFCEHIVHFGRQNGTEYLNLSPDSLVSTIPKCTIEEFDNWYGG